MLAPCARSVSGRWASWSPCSSPERSGRPSRRTSRPSARCPPGSSERLEGGFWRPGVPVALSELRLLTVRHWGFDGEGRRPASSSSGGSTRTRCGASSGVLYDEGFRIRHMRLVRHVRPGGRTAGAGRQRIVRVSSGGAVALWLGVGQLVEPRLRAGDRPQPGREPVRRLRSHARAASRPYLDRSRTRPGMVTPAVVSAFAAIGWGWGGSWTGDTKDFMHFSATGR